MANRLGNLYDWCLEQGEKGQRIIEEFIGDELEDDTIELSDEVWSEWADLKIDSDDSKAIKMQSYSKNSQNKVWWKCIECQDVYYKSVSARTIQSYGCFKCGHRHGGIVNMHNAARKNSLYDWCNKNGVFGKKLLEEWDGEANLNEYGISMHDVSNNSSILACWKCVKCGNKFNQMIYKRVTHRIGCNQCNVRGTSYPEQFIYYSLKQVFSDTVSRGVMFGGYEYDIVIPSRKLCIEYNGCYYHSNSKDRDKIKVDLCIKNGYRLIVIEDNIECKNQSVMYSNEKVRYCYASKNSNEQIKDIVKYIVELMGENYNNIDFEKATYDTDNRMYNELDDNVLKKYPMLEKEFVSELNNGLNLSYFTAGSHKNIKWKCTKCNKCWSVIINCRTKFKTGCPHCGYNVFKDKYNKNSITKKRNYIQPNMFSL